MLARLLFARPIKQNPMERRELLKIMAMTLGSSIALPESVFAKMGEAFNPADLTYFSDSQRQQVAALSEAIIPKTDTPGAIEAGVPGWIEVIVKDCLTPENQLVITDGLAEITMRCAKENGKPIAELDPADQVAFLTKVDNETKAAKNAQIQAGKRVPDTFLEQFKELTKFCYVNSEVGATQAFDYMLVPGKWIPDMKLEPGMKAYSM